ncbi:MAG: tRNA (adenosine(37)-N6)-threonylcarbamoyltransferase complex ATPase subunit type 1 TsaE [Mycoplasmatales bacterium]
MLVNNVEELDDLALEFIKKLNPGNVIFLHGPIGVGKTTFVQKVAKHLQIGENVTSPTFNVIKEYSNILCHIDAYRLSNEAIDLDKYINNHYYIFVEWPDNIDSSIISPDYNIYFEYNNEKRDIKIT